jgi:hypothetical protein
MCRFFTPFYFKSCISSGVILQWSQQRNSIKFCVNLGKSATETLAMIKQAFGEESMSHAWKSPNSLRPEKVRQVKSKVKNMIIIFFDIKQIVHKEFVLAGQTMFYGKCVKMCEDFAPNFGDKRTGCCSMTMHRLTLPFPPGNF